MDIFDNLFDVIWKLALPVAGLSYLMVWWALKKGVLSEMDGLRALSKEIDAMGKRHKDKKQESPKVNPVHGKWLKFGGGFYGTVALYTYGLIEWNEVRETISRLGGIAEFFSSLSVGLIINMVIEGLLNFIAAITWPVYWISEFGSRNMWVWMLVAYGSYWLGMRIAQIRAKSPRSS